MEFSNPLAPSGHTTVPDTPSRNMTNADFRKLMMTPRANVPAAGSAGSTGGRSERISAPGSMGAPAPKGVASATPSHSITERKKKKQYYASLRKAEDDKLAELAARYRDRAKERREGATTETVPTDESISATAAGYHAVAPDLKSNLNAAERRKQLIQESKFLGGDMEHTHLVKGLDYALLQKVRSEIEATEKEENEFEEALRAKQEEKQKQDKRAKEEVEEQTKLMFRTAMAKNINRLLFSQKSSRVERNELFLPHRMAYVIELDEAEGDIPTALIRSKQDCPQMALASATLTTNDIVINKLTQILGYLRSGLSIRKSKKRGGVDKGTGDSTDPKAKEGEGARNPSVARDNVSIFDDVGEYHPQRESGGATRKNRRASPSRETSPMDQKDDRDRLRDHRGERADRGEKNGKRPAASRYFTSSTDDLVTEKTFESSQSDVLLRTALKATQQQASDANKDSKESGGRFKDKLARLTQQEDYYSECYPGMPENDDAVADSDEEEDLSKMDNGKRKGPLNRWDFESQEEYAAYMDRKEALPKAAFQYGVKMAEGRRTKGAAGPQGQQIQGQKKDKMKLDRELQQINQILAKRRAGDSGGNSGGKQARYED
ncbi:protein Red-like [Varroa destructor]|uniref:Protein Red n=1 Tax=Varroa destructor TaxID=109461 RepID=A0A7M7K2M6_VARDE|nr:protein Red-like [Varroa destructor]